MLGLALPVRAQTGNEGSIEGTVVDPSGAVLPGVALQARNLNTSATFLATTDALGLFRFPILPLGSYELEAQRKGFATLIVKDVAVTVGARRNLTLSLRVASLEENIIVSGETPLVETTRSQVSATVDAGSVANLPVNGRNFIDFVLLTPGVASDVFGGLSIAGQRKLNTFLVDGTDSNTTFFGEALSGAGFGRDPYQYSLAAVQEFQVNTHSYAAEFGRAGGGAVNVVTKSGSNEFHGEAFWFYRDRGLSATDFINKLEGQPKSPFHFHQFGGSAGGPLRRNKLFFFLVYDGQRSRIPNVTFLNLPAGFTLSGDPGVAASQQQALDYLRARADSWTRTFNQDTYFTKTDWQVRPAHQLSARWNRQRFTGENLENRGPQNSEEHTGPALVQSDTVGLSLTSTLSPSAVNVARFSYVASDEIARANTANPEANIFESGQLVLTIGRNAISPREVSIRRGQWTDTVSYNRGRHLLKAGLDVLADWMTFFTAVNFSGSHRFNNLDSFGRSLAGVPAPRPGESYLQAFSGEGTPGTTVRPDMTQLGVFVQDGWRLGPRLTLNLGLRYDTEWLAKVRVSNPSPALASAGLDTAFTPADQNNFSPRFGFAWAPRRNIGFVVRGGYGIYHWFTPSILSSRAHFQNGVTVQTTTLLGGTPGGAFIPAYPNSLCGPPDPTGAPPSCPPPAGVSSPLLIFFDPEYQDPLIQQGSFGVERQLLKDLALSVSYLWTHGTHLQRLRDVNLSAPIPATIGISNITTMLTFQRFPAERPIPAFDRISLIESSASSVYHGLVVRLDKRFAHRYQFAGSYIWSKVIDDVPDATGVNPGSGDRRLLSDPSNPRLDRAAGINDLRHRLALSGIWQLDYAGNLPAGAKAILRGWELSGILTVQSGRPYSGQVNFDLNNDGNSATDRTPGLGRNTFYTPWQSSLDLRTTRTVALSGRVRLQFLWEAFNLLNRANITGVRTTQFSHSTSASICGVAGTPCLVPHDTGPTAFGTPTTTAGPRIMQLAIKLLF